MNDYRLNSECNHECELPAATLYSCCSVTRMLSKSRFSSRRSRGLKIYSAKRKQEREERRDGSEEGGRRERRGEMGGKREEKREEGRERRGVRGEERRGERKFNQR